MKAYNFEGEQCRRPGMLCSISGAGADTVARDSTFRGFRPAVPAPAPAPAQAIPPSNAGRQDRLFKDVMRGLENPIPSNPFVSGTEGARFNEIFGGRLPVNQGVRGPATINEPGFGGHAFGTQFANGVAPAGFREAEQKFKMQQSANRGIRASSLAPTRSGAFGQQQAPRRGVQGKQLGKL